MQFFGSDIESGYSYIYTWLANKFGHFMIGFAGTILLGWLVIWLVSLRVPVGNVGYLWHWPWAGIGVAAIWLLLWVFKEWLLDVASALRNLSFAERQRKELLANPPGKVDRPRYFWPKAEDWKQVRAALWEQYVIRHWRPPAENADVEEWFRYDVVRDSQMDIWFYLAGILTALAMYAAPELAKMWGEPTFTGLVPLLTFAAVLVASVLLSQDWLWANIAFDRAQLPFVARFALNSRPPEKQTRTDALTFATKSDSAPGHLLIIGPPKSGRTTTAVALGVEALLQALPPRDVVVYTTLCKLLDRVAEEQIAFSARDQSGPPGERPVWPPKDAELLIVDDVGAQGAKRALLSPAAFKTELLNNKLLRQMCDGKRVIWVVGDDPRRSKQWIAALKTAFEKDSPVPHLVPPVKLRAPIPHEERLRPSQKVA